MEYPNLALEREGNIAVVTLNRPHRRNALSLDLMQELIAVLESIASDESAHAVILAAAGPVYCSGHDLNEMRDCTVTQYRRIFEICGELMTKLQSIPQPVIAEVQGIATAAGCQLVASLRPRCRQRAGTVRSAGREDRAVLYHADGRSHKGYREQARDGDAADGTHDRRANGR